MEWEQLGQPRYTFTEFQCRRIQDIPQVQSFDGCLWRCGRLLSRVRFTRFSFHPEEKRKFNWEEPKSSLTTPAKILTPARGKDELREWERERERGRKKTKSIVIISRQDDDDNQDNVRNRGAAPAGLHAVYCYCCRRKNQAPLSEEREIEEFFFTFFYYDDYYSLFV